VIAATPCSAYGEQHDRHAVFLRHQHLAQVDARLGVVQDAAAAEEQQVQALDLRRHLRARQLAHRDGALDLVALLGVLRIAREHRDLHAGHLAPQLLDHRLEDGLVAEVQAAVRAGDAYLWAAHTRAPVAKSGPAGTRLA